MARKNGAPVEVPENRSRPAKPAQRSSDAPAAVEGTRSATSRDIEVHQIYYEDWQRELLDPTFVPLDNSAFKSELLEFDVFRRLAPTEGSEKHLLWGALSWRFTEKTSLTGEDLYQAIESSPGKDVYYFNPYPRHEALYHNLWVQGETVHPEFLRIAEEFLVAAELPVDDIKGIWPARRYSASNYFVGSPAFWRLYLSFVETALAKAEKNLSSTAKLQLRSKAADVRGVHKGANYLPFIIERLFPIFLRTEGRLLAAQQIRIPSLEEEMDAHLQLLRELKDVAYGTKSSFLAACWINYRALYLTQQFGKKWASEQLPKVTPLEILFP